MAIKLQGLENQPRARVGEQLPGRATDGGAAAAQGAAEGFARFSAKIGEMADRAAHREGAQAGQAAGAAAGDARQPLALGRTDTIRGRAADEAALNAYGWRLEANLRADVSAAGLEYVDDPVALDKALTDLRGRFEQEIGADPQIRESFGQRFAALSQPHRERAAEKLFLRNKAEESAAAADLVEALSIDAERVSRDAAGREDRAEATKAEISRSLWRIESMGESGALTPDQVRGAKRRLLGRAEMASLRGGFDLLEGDPEGQARYAEGLLDLWGRGEIGADVLGESDIRSLSQGMSGQARGEINRRKAEAEAARREVEQDLQELSQASALGMGLAREEEIRSRAEAVGMSAAFEAAHARRGVELWLMEQPPQVRAAFIEQLRGAPVGDQWSLAAMGRWIGLDKSLTDRETQEAKTAARLAEAEAKDADREARALAKEEERELRADLGVHRAAHIMGTPYAFEDDLKARVAGTSLEPVYQRNLSDAARQRAYEGADAAGRAAMYQEDVARGVHDREGLTLIQAWRTATREAHKEEFGAYKDQADELIKAYGHDRPLAWTDSWMADPNAPARLKDLVRKAGNYSAQRVAYRGQATADEARRALTAYGATPMETTEDVEAVEKFAGVVSDLEKRVKDDPLKFVADQKRVAIGPVDLTDSATIRSRADAADLARPLHGQGRIYFTNDERDRFEIAFGEADRDGKLAMTASLVQGAGKAHAHGMIADLGLKDRQLAHAAHLVVSTGSQAVAREILHGQEIRADKNFEAPSPADVLQGMSSAFSAFSSAGESALTSVRESAVSIAATRMRRTGESFSRVFPEALQAAAGGVMDRKGERQGGLQMVNRQMTLLPAGQKAENIAAALRNSTPETLAAASLTGRPPPMVAGAQPSGADLQIFASGDWVYAVGVRQRDGSVEHLPDPASPSGVYEIDLRRLQGITP